MCLQLRFWNVLLSFLVSIFWGSDFYWIFPSHLPIASVFMYKLISGPDNIKFSSAFWNLISRWYKTNKETSKRENKIDIILLAFFVKQKNMRSIYELRMFPLNNDALTQRRGNFGDFCLMSKCFLNITSGWSSYRFIFFDS